MQAGTLSRKIRFDKCEERPKRAALAEFRPISAAFQYLRRKIRFLLRTSTYHTLLLSGFRWDQMRLHAFSCNFLFDS